MNADYLVYPLWHNFYVYVYLYHDEMISIDKISDLIFKISDKQIYELWLLWNLLHGQINWVYKRNFQLNIRTE